MKAKKHHRRIINNIMPVIDQQHADKEIKSFLLQVQDVSRAFSFLRRLTGQRRQVMQS